MYSSGVPPDFDPQFDDLFESAGEGLVALCRLQALYDEVGWRIQEPSWAKTRHIMLHLMKVTAHVAGLVESVEHAEERGDPPTSEAFRAVLQEHRRVAADLAFHAAQLANLGDFDLADEVRALYRENAARFAPDSPFADL
jgi:hypothetical protein